MINGRGQAWQMPKEKMMIASESPACEESEGIENYYPNHKWSSHHYASIPWSLRPCAKRDPCRFVENLRNAPIVLRAALCDRNHRQVRLQRIQDDAHEKTNQGNVMLVFVGRQLDPPHTVLNFDHSVQGVLELFGRLVDHISKLISFLWVHANVFEH